MPIHDWEPNMYSELHTIMDNSRGWGKLAYNTCNKKTRDICVKFVIKNSMFVKPGTNWVAPSRSVNPEALMLKLSIFL